MNTGMALNTDITKGMFDHFRSLPIARSAPLAGRGPLVVHDLAVGQVDQPPANGGERRRVGVGLGVVGHPGAGRITVHTPAAGDGLPEVLVVGEPSSRPRRRSYTSSIWASSSPARDTGITPAPDEGTHEVTAGRSR
jgi:hypothetical protein